MKNSKTYDTFIFRQSWWDQIKLYPDCNREKIYDALCKYVFEGIEPEFDPMDAISVATRFIISDIKTDKDKYEEVCTKRSEAGRRHTGNQYTRARTEQTEQMEQMSQNGTNGTEYEYDNDKEKGIENENEKDKSFSFSQKKEKIIFNFSMTLLSEGRPNAYREACEAFEYNESTGWTTETTKPNGDIQKKKITNPLSWLKGWKRSNEQLFAPADGILFAEFMKKSCDTESIRPENECIINDFRGISEFEDGISLLFTSRRTLLRFHAIVEGNEKVKQILFGEIRKKYPNATMLNYKTN